MPQGAATVADIGSASWSLMLDATANRGPGSGIGNIVQALDDVNQCIGIILRTHPGEDPLRPTFGCDLLQYLDAPLPVAKSKVIASVVNVLALWEPRITVQSVNVQMPSASPGTLQVTVHWQVNLGSLGPSVQRFGAIGPQTTTILFG